MASAFGFAVDIVMVINITINKTLNVHDLVKNIIYAGSTNIMKVINIDINKTFGIHDLLNNYLCYNVFNREDMNTFNVLAFIQVRTDTNNFKRIRNIDTFSVLILILTSLYG